MARSLVERLTTVICIPAIFVVLATSYILLRPATYEATATLDVVKLRLLPGGGAGVFLPEAQTLPTFLDTQGQIIGSTSIVTAALRILEGTPAEDALQTTGPISNIVELENFRRRLKVSRVGQSNLINLAFQSDDPQASADTVNAVVAAFLAKLKQDRLETAEAASSWLQEQLRSVGPRATVVSSAYPPIHKSNVRGLLIIAIAGVVGGFVGLFAALMTSFLDTRIRNPEQLARIIGKPCLGVAQTKRSTIEKPGENAHQNDFSAPEQQDGFDTSALFNISALIQSSASDTGNRMRYVGVTSLNKSNGSAFIAWNLARVLSAPNQEVLLVDADPYSFPSSSDEDVPQTKGIIDILEADGTSLEQVITKDPNTGLSTLPIGTVSDPRLAGQQIWSDSLTELKPTFRKYDLVIFNLPPLFATTDVSAASKYLDSIVFVAKWAKTSQADLETALSLSPSIHKKVIGSVLINAKENPLIFLVSPVANFLRKQRLFLSGASK